MTISKSILIDAAKAFLMVYFSDNKKHRPSDFDIDILGSLDVASIFRRPKWNNTIFCDALTEMVEDDKTIDFGHDEEGYWYRLHVYKHVR